MDGDDLVFLYQLKEGICQSSYAANIAKLAGLPACLVHRAVEVTTQEYKLRDTLTHAHRLIHAFMFSKVSEHYRTGKPIKHRDKASSDEQAKRFVKLYEVKGTIKDLRG